jgi:hypothetical protein
VEVDWSAILRRLSNVFFGSKWRVALTVLTIISLAAMWFGPFGREAYFAVRFVTIVWMFTMLREVAVNRRAAALAKRSHGAPKAGES